MACSCSWGRPDLDKSAIAHNQPVPADKDVTTTVTAQPPNTAIAPMCSQLLAAAHDFTFPGATADRSAADIDPPPHSAHPESSHLAPDVAQRAPKQ